MMVSSRTVIKKYHVKKPKKDDEDDK